MKNLDGRFDIVDISSVNSFIHVHGYEVLQGAFSFLWDLHESDNLFDIIIYEDENEDHQQHFPFFLFSIGGWDSRTLGLSYNILPCLLLFLYNSGE